MTYIPQITRGDMAPDLELRIADSRSDANFGTLTPADVRFTVEQNGFLIVDDEPATAVVPDPGNKSAIVRRAWGAGETDTSGRCWVTVRVVPWDQTFPDEGPLRLDIARQLGDA